MRLVNGNITGVDITITGSDDVIQPVDSWNHCSFMIAHKKTAFINCKFFNCRGVLNITAVGEEESNHQNKALRIHNPEEINSEEWCIISGQTFDGCAFPVMIEGRNCEIYYDISPELREQFNSEREWNRFLKEHEEMQQKQLRG